MNKQKLIDYFDKQATERDNWKKRNSYYHQSLEKLCRFIVPEFSHVLEVGSGTGDLLNALKPKHGVGIDISYKMIEIARVKYPYLTWQVDDAESLSVTEKFDYVVMTDVLG